MKEMIIGGFVMILASLLGLSRSNAEYLIPSVVGLIAGVVMICVPLYVNYCPTPIKKIDSR